MSVETYTISDYTTGDIDLVLAGRDKTNEVLLDLGFERHGRNWFHNELEIAVEIPDNLLDGNYDKIITMKLSNQKKIYVVGIEDVISDRLRLCIHWKSTEDCEWGYRLFFIHREELDLDYLKEKATKDLTIDRLNEWMN